MPNFGRFVLGASETPISSRPRVFKSEESTGSQTGVLNFTLLAVALHGHPRYTRDLDTGLLDVVLVEAAVERGAADAEQFGGLGAVAVGLLQRGPDALGLIGRGGGRVG